MRKYRTFLPIAVGNILQKVTPKLIPKKSYMVGTIIHDWSTIVGENLAHLTQPYKITFAKGISDKGTLHVYVRDNSTSMMIHHQQSTLLDTINRYLGHTVLSQIALRIGSFPTTPSTQKPAYRSLSQDETNAIIKTLDSLPDGPLKESLRRLGTTLREVTK